AIAPPFCLDRAHGSLSSNRESGRRTPVRSSGKAQRRSCPHLSAKVSCHSFPAREVCQGYLYTILRAPLGLSNERRTLRFRRRAPSLLLVLVRRSWHVPERLVWLSQPIQLRFAV